MKKNRTITKIAKSITTVLILVTTSLFCFGQSRQEMTDTIFSKLKLIESRKMNYEFQLEHLKYQFTGSDSIKIIELEKKMTEDEIVSRLNIAFIEVFRDEEILEIYHFVKTRAFEKFFNSRETHKIIDSKFIDIDKEIEEISNHIDEIVENPTNKFETIPVDRENGFYATVDYDFSAADKDIKLEDQPSLTLKDILEVKKDFSSYNNRPEISIVFTKEGAKKFYLLTKENIGKPLAIVLEKHIVFMPLINSEIVGGKVSISGDFSEMEVDKMIEILKE